MRASNLLPYEFSDGPEDSINGMLRKLVTDLRYNRSMVSIEEFRSALVDLRGIERRLQSLDTQIGQPIREYIDDIMNELNEESDIESIIEDELRMATIATVSAVIGMEIEFDQLAYVVGKANQYHWVQLLGYKDERPVDSCLIIAVECFRAICSKYNYIFINLT
jgi:hypothetical protein